MIAWLMQTSSSQSGAGDSFPEQLREVVLPLFAVTTDAQWHAIGTAFVVVAAGLNALLVTAGHNLEHFQRLALPPSRRHPSMPGIFASPEPSIIETKAEIYAMLRKRGKIALATYGRAFRIEGIDIALISVSLHEDDDVKFDMSFSIDSSPFMPIGLPLTAFGFRKLEAESWQDWEKENFEARISEGELVVRTGKVLSNAEAGRGSRFTGTYVDIPFDSGMSGGPVVEYRGDEPFVRAVITSDLSSDPKDQAAGSGQRAFASSIWMLAGIPVSGINVERQDGNVETCQRVLDLIANGRIRDVGAAHRFVQVECLDGDVSRSCPRWTSSAVEQNGPKELSTSASAADGGPKEISTMLRAPIYFVAREIVGLMLKSQGIHEGHWVLVVRFSTTAVNSGLNGGEVLPSAIVQVQQLGLEQVSEPTAASVDAAIVNPAAPPTSEGSLAAPL